ncbi:MAG: hypothetical protein ACREFX_13970 [Opitutaceae bacterium]
MNASPTGKLRGHLLTVLAGTALLGAGCAGPAVRRPEAPAKPESAADQARREERLKLMQRYWLERTGATAGAGRSAPLPGPVPPLSYPTGCYDGLWFSARTAASPSLGEPAR